MHRTPAADVGPEAELNAMVPSTVTVHAARVPSLRCAADVIVIGGNGFRAVGTIETLERNLGRPVVTANQALLWACLAAAESSAKIDHYGLLLR